MVRQTTIQLSEASAGTAQRIERRLWITPGVWVAHVNRATATVYVEFDSDQWTPDALAQAVAAWS